MPTSDYPCVFQLAERQQVPRLFKVMLGVASSDVLGLLGLLGLDLCLASHTGQEGTFVPSFSSEKCLWVP